MSRAPRPPAVATERRPVLRPGLLGRARTMGIDRVTGEVVSALEAAGIPTILLKGPSIARWLYPDGGRTYTDTDLLVRASDHGRASGVLAGLGFVDALEGFHLFERRTSPAVASTFLRPAQAGGGNVDLHRNLPILPTADDLLWVVFSAETTTMAVGGRDVVVLNRAGVALHVVLHAVQTGFRLHTDEDLRRALAASSAHDWEEVAALATRLGVAGVLGAGLRHQPAGAVVADRLGLTQLDVAGTPYALSLLGGRGAVSMALLRDATTWRERVAAVRWTLVPSPAKIRYVSERPDAKGVALAGAYLRWWVDVVKAVAPAAKLVRRARYPAGAPGEKVRG